ncbi:hypothetical protein [Clostridium brassicae]|uniref:SMI1/KNR4 family protein n=1 Tax=Clostridium brassicae TaxID=2999072 RepID=A0ABT4DD59_9CLOT|nr:hypothetical protein [Clostridium brassicae]MCY6960253.1 hypothetical protein [Clostridium brassicae]
MNIIIEDEHYYNNTYDIDNGILFIDRVYMVDEYKFNEDTYKKLENIYKSLPGYIENPTSVYCWYGDEGKGDKFYLLVSFEPSGLQFIGKLHLDCFIKWEEKFNVLIADFPFKYH